MEKCGRMCDCPDGICVDKLTKDIGALIAKAVKSSKPCDSCQGCSGNCTDKQEETLSSEFTFDSPVSSDVPHPGGIEDDPED